MSVSWGTLAFVAVLNLFAVGVFTGHVPRFVRWYSEWSRALDRALTPPWRQVWKDAMERQFPTPDLSDGLQVAAVLIVIFTLLGAFLVFVGRFG